MIHQLVQYQQSLTQHEEELVAWEVLLDQDKQETAPTVQQQYGLQMEMAELVIFTAHSNPDILYLHEAMRAPDCKLFLQAMKPEIEGLEDGKHWVLIPKTQLPKGTKVLDAVWLM